MAPQNVHNGGKIKGGDHNWSVNGIQDAPRSGNLLSYIFDGPRALALEETPRPVCQSAASGESISYTLAELRDQVRQLASGLRKAGFEDGDRLFLLSANAVTTPVVMFGTIAAGGIFTGGFADYKMGELLHHLRDSKPRYLLVAPGLQHLVWQAASKLAIPRNRIFLYDAPGRSRRPSTRASPSWTQILDLEGGSTYQWSCLSEQQSRETIAMVQYTSGSTGARKGGQLSHHALIMVTWLTVQNLLARKCTDLRSALCTYALSHTSGSRFLLATLKMGIKNILVAQSSDLVDAVRSSEPELLSVPRPGLELLASNAQPGDLRSVREIWTSGTTMPLHIAEQLVSQHNLSVLNRYGSTEAGLLSACDPDDPLDGSVGRLLPMIEYRTVGSSGKVVGIGKRGELHVRHPGLLTGYLNNEEGFNEVLTADGWYKTGDIAYLAKDQRLFIVDRKKDMMKVQGLQVAPAEIESVVSQVPGVKAATVTSRKRNAMDDDLPEAFVVPSKKQKVDVGEIHGAIEDQLSSFKSLSGGINFVDGLPVNSGGKIMRSLLEKT